MGKWKYSYRNELSEIKLKIFAHAVADRHIVDLTRKIESEYNAQVILSDVVP